MTCPKCKGEWCWMCRGDWKTHGTNTGGFYKCDFYDKGKTIGNKLDKKMEESKYFHDIYIQYFNNWQHHNSLLNKTLSLGDSILLEVET